MVLDPTSASPAGSVVGVAARGSIGVPSSANSGFAGSALGSIGSPSAFLGLKCLSASSDAPWLPRATPQPEAVNAKANRTTSDFLYPHMATMLTRAIRLRHRYLNTLSSLGQHSPDREFGASPTTRLP